MSSYLRILRPLNCIMAVVAAYIGALISGLNFIPDLILIYAFISVFLICAGGMVINDYFDVEIDKINRPNRPIPSGKMGKYTALIYSILLFAVGLYFAFRINYTALGMAVFAAAVLVAYAGYFKKVILVGNILVSALVALTFIYGALINMNYMSTLFLALLAFLSNTGREIFKDAEDVLGDKKLHVISLPIKYGVHKARAAATLFIIAAVILSFVPFFLGIFGFVYLFFVTIADIVFVVAVSVPIRYSTKLIKIAMIVALIAFLVAAFYGS